MRGAALALALLLAPGPAAGECKLALALGLDVSSSVDATEYALQRDGLAAAFDDREIIEAMLTPEGAHVAVSAYEWSGAWQQDTAIGWTVIDSPGAAHAFAAQLRALQRASAWFGTALGEALAHGAGLLRAAPACGRRVLDISGDGANNDGKGPEHFRRDGVLEGILVNGLVIKGEIPDPAVYYRAHVVQGPDAFVALARGYPDFGRAIAAKLLREVSGDLVIGRAP